MTSSRVFGVSSSSDWTAPNQWSCAPRPLPRPADGGDQAPHPPAPSGRASFLTGYLGSHEQIPHHIARGEELPLAEKEPRTPAIGERPVVDRSKSLPEETEGRGEHPVADVTNPDVDEAGRDESGFDLSGGH